LSGEDLSLGLLGQGNEAEEGPSLSNVSREKSWVSKRNEFLKRRWEESGWGFEKKIFREGEDSRYPRGKVGERDRAKRNIA